MEKYVKVYSFELIKRIEEGKKVYMLDRSRSEVGCVNGMSVGEFVNLRSDLDEDGRYDFWYIEEGDTQYAEL